MLSLGPMKRHFVSAEVQLAEAALSSHVMVRRRCSRQRISMV